PIPNIIGFYKQKDKKIIFKTFQDLKRYRIGSVLGYAYPKEFLEANLRNNKSYTDEVLMEKLVQGKIDLALIDKIQAEYLLNKKHADQSDKFVFLEPPIEIKDQHLVISKKTKNAQKIINDFNHGLKIIIDDGTFKDILKRHNFSSQL
ncbi:MAG: ABC transporter substrate-binding protein, partial [bacterium]|nr:ABC transporter substrate-binding protein [bacterium]